MGGEKKARPPAPGRPLGSPPRGRGKVSTCCCASIGGRITPAWAGKSRAALSPKNCSRDHPRVGGEKPAVAAHVRAQLGSPPRGRGKGMISPPFDNPKRITPAWAGKSLYAELGVGAPRDHPRVGGEKILLRRRGRRALGSPPRGRGKEAGCFAAAIAGGITPAWAGKRPLSACQPFFAGDHPRVGGEKALSCSCVIYLQGSPPRGRGKEENIALIRACFRITPAWAGKSRRRPTQGWIFRDHPRVGGEKIDGKKANAYYEGSPPRGRGKAWKPGEKRPESGITPAWAGKRC